MVIWAGPIGVKVGWGLISSGVSHFGTAFAIYNDNKAAGWDAASNYAGFSSPTISINVDSWFDGKSDKNGINQNEPAVTTKSDTDGNSGQGSGGDCCGENISPAQHAIIKARHENRHSYINLSDSKHYPGIKIFQNKNKLDDSAVTLPGVGIYIGGGYQNEDLKMVMQHEYGHFLDYKLSPDMSYNGLNLVNYYTKIGLPSILNTGFGWGGRHKTFWTEIRANQWAKLWFGKNLHPFFLKNYPIKK